MNFITFDMPLIVCFLIMFFLELDLYYYLRKQESQVDILKYERLKSLNNTTMLYPITLFLIWFPFNVIYSLQALVFNDDLIILVSVLCSLQGTAVMLSSLCIVLNVASYGKGILLSIC